ncbi:hypothetical protein MLD38_040574 [Melastoma candidum]|nr:hypothetical protein MLD38_040574 [Melastoma candidum]
MDSKVTRCLSQVQGNNDVRISIDLVSAARRNIGFLRSVDASPWIHEEPAIAEAIRRYEELWMPLMSGLTTGSTPPMILPPVDVEWVWFCHTLNPAGYRQYCESRFSKLIGKPAIFDEENEEYALLRCREIWIRRYPSEPFMSEVNSDGSSPYAKEGGLLDEVLRHRSLCSLFSEPFMTEIMYLIASTQRYKGFLHILPRIADEGLRFVPTIDILLIWVTHQSYPPAYTEDLKESVDNAENVARLGDVIKQEEVEESKELWDRIFNHPYERAGGWVALDHRGIRVQKPPIYWEAFDEDANTRYKSMMPRFLLEVCTFVKLDNALRTKQKNLSRDFLRLRVARCHTELKIDQPITSLSYNTWQKAWHLYCEFGTRGIIVELRGHRGGFLGGSKSKITEQFLWNDLLRAPTLTMGKELQPHCEIVTSVTPPVQAPYFLKCVPDQVTDDSGAMVSDIILRMNQYRPQEGRWLSRTVLDHAGRECFVVRIRIGGGIWRRGGETPTRVKWEDRIIEIREGSWSYVAGSIGRAPEKVIGTATPREPEEGWDAAWSFSTGDELMLRWHSTASGFRPTYCITNRTSSESTVKLLRGRRIQYIVPNADDETTHDLQCNESQDDGAQAEDEQEHDFVTVVRYTEEHSTGRATALINWKLMVMEFIPEEDAILVLLLCLSLLRSASEMRKQDLGKLLLRRRLKEPKLGSRDWGSVILGSSPDKCSTSPASPFLQPWYWNADVVMASDQSDSHTRQPTLNLSQVLGSDALYKKVILN